MAVSLRADEVSIFRDRTRPLLEGGLVATSMGGATDGYVVIRKKIPRPRRHAHRR
jgi:hypothetical protein